MDFTLSNSDDGYVGRLLFPVSRLAGCMGGPNHKLTSPPKPMASRSASGISPVAFLQSPVLLSHLKTEPSPTTGSFIKPHMVHASSGSNTRTFDQRKWSWVEFRPLAKENTVPADVNYHQSEMAVSRNELSLSMVPSGGCASPDDDGYELNQRGKANTGAERLQHGQLHVKGSEFPCSYYKFTHRNCQVEKLCEYSNDVQITDIISRRYSADVITLIQGQKREKSSSLTSENDGMVEASPVTAYNDCLEGATGSLPKRKCDHDVNVDINDPLAKQRKTENGRVDVDPVVIKPIREPRVIVQTQSEVDILDDGYRWRKYGQKVVRGNPNPRSYYKCTNSGCGVRKHVERASHDPKAVITTYEGKHNHETPIAKSSNQNTESSMAMCRLTRYRSEESDAISHALGVQANPVSSYVGVLSRGINQFGLTDNLPEGQGVILLANLQNTW